MRTVAMMHLVHASAYDTLAHTNHRPRECHPENQQAVHPNYKLLSWLADMNMQSTMNYKLAKRRKLWR
jgi:hypothetical protein